jgi:hypothetical protein
MPEARIGRVVVASLHQAIGDVLPQRLEFYESWLNTHGLREGTIGLAPLLAVTSFLRTEGRVYGEIVSQAGEYAADWSVSSMSPFKRRLYLLMPGWLRTRLALGVARDLIKESYPGSKALTRIRRGTVTIDLRGSLFCTVRQTAASPLCGFYSAAAVRILKLFNLPAEPHSATCRAVGDAGCEAVIAIHAARPGAEGESHAVGPAAV